MTTILFIALQAVLIAGGALAYISGQDPDRLNQFVQSQDSSDASTKGFSEARNLIKDGEWAKAEQSFNRFIASHPKDKDIAAAHYWLAFALKQQNRFQDADKWLIQLIEKFPGSSWVTDARAMRVEIAPRLKNNKVIEQGVSAENEEIKLAALQSLFEAKPERAIAIAADILKSGSGASRLMKEGAIALLRDSDSKQAIPVLIDAARNETDHELRKKAIRGLGEREQDSVVDELLKLFASDRDETIRKEILSALSEIKLPRAQAAILEVARTADSVELRKKAIQALSDQDGEEAVDSLIQLYDAEKDERMKEVILNALGDSEQKKALRKLMDVVRREPSLRLKKKALAMIGESEDPEAMSFLEELLKK